MKRRGGLAGEFALALPPTLTVLVVLVGLEWWAGERVLFASLASSAFLIYRDPSHPMNGARVMTTAHLLGCGLGAGAAMVLGTGYSAAAAAMVATIVALVLLDVVHPAAVSTALGFAFSPAQRDAAGAFLFALGLIASLVALQRIALFTLHRVTKRPSGG